MTALFVVATILLCIGIELLRERAKQRKAVPKTERVSADRFLLPRGFFISKAHTWVEVTYAGDARIGIDDFAQKIIGKIEQIEIVLPGSEFKKGETFMTLRHGSRVLSIPAPISGKVSEVNNSLLDSPHLLHQDPYVAGWVAVIIPKNISAELRFLTIADESAQWLRKEISRFRDFIKTQTAIPAPAGITMLDGGTPLSSVLEQLNEGSWNAFQKEFLSMEQTH